MFLLALFFSLFIYFHTHFSGRVSAEFPKITSTKTSRKRKTDRACTKVPTVIIPIILQLNLIPKLSTVHCITPRLKKNTPFLETYPPRARVEPTKDKRDI